MNKKGVFGLTSVQQFFAIILGLALLAYVIVVIMGTLNSSSITATATESGNGYDASGWINSTGYAFEQASIKPGFGSPVIVYAWNKTGAVLLNSANYTITDNKIYNASPLSYNSANITYTYKYDSQTKVDEKNILTNTSAGITSFFSSISSVWAILAILVIILVLVVLVRVVVGGSGVSGSRMVEPQL